MAITPSRGRIDDTAGLGVLRTLVEEIVDERRPTASGSTRLVRRNKALFYAGDDFRYLYVVTSGVFKSYRISTEGTQKVLDFYLPGDIIGLDAIARRRYTHNVVALDTSNVCLLSYTEVEELCRRSTDFQRLILEKMSAELADNEDMMLMLGTKNADARVASMLLDLSAYYRSRGFSPTEFRLPMTRTDMAGYLGLAVETVSRALTRMQKTGVVAVESNSVRILNYEDLFALAEIEPGTRPCVIH